METDIAIYATSYVLTRMLLLMAIGYVVYQVLRPARAEASSAQSRAEHVAEDRC